MSAYLIAQLGKNYTDGRNKEITGTELLELAWSVIEDMQYRGGGMVVFLEANNEEKLLSFSIDITRYVTDWFFLVNSTQLFFKKYSTSGFLGQENSESSLSSAGSPASSSAPNAKYSRENIIKRKAGSVQVKSVRNGETGKV